MDIFDVLTLIGGLCLFLFGMNVMGKALERRAGDKLRSILEKMTTSRLSGFLAGCGITAIIQSSSATTVMVVGFVNSGLMTLRQAINVIMGSNVGTTITAWVLSLSGISSDNVLVQLLKPTSFVPVVALIGIIMLMSKGSDKRNDTGMILLGFATLMFGMETMSSAVSGLAELPAFQQLLVAFDNPLMGDLAGAAFTAIIQSSSAAVGVIQVLAMTGQITYGAVIPIIMGTCIGTCVTAMLSSIGTKREAQQAALAHLTFNVLGSVIWIIVFMIIRSAAEPAGLAMAASLVGIAVINTAFNVFTAAIFLPAASVLERIVLAIYPNKPVENPVTAVLEGLELDERLFVTPALALERCEKVGEEMANFSLQALKNGMHSINHYSQELADTIREDEEKTDLIEDALGSYLVKLSACDLSIADNERISVLLKVIGDYERIADHGINLLESAEEIQEKSIKFTDNACREMKVLTEAVTDVAERTTAVFQSKDISNARDIEPLEEVIDDLKEEMRSRHILRLKEGKCSAEAGFVWADILNDLERCSDHCSNIAACLIDAESHTRNMHETLRFEREQSTFFTEKYTEFKEQYSL